MIEEQPWRHHFYPLPAAHMRQLLVSCAKLISQSDFASALQVVSLLNSSASHYGNSTERLLVHHFTEALSIHLTRLTSSSLSFSSFANFTSTESLHSSYLNLNQAILEAMEGRRLIHILDLDTMQGVQWLPFMQALADRSGPTNPRPIVRITGAGQDIDVLCTSATASASSPRRSTSTSTSSLSTSTTTATSTTSSAPPVYLHPDESLNVNCIFSLHKLLSNDLKDLHLFLQSVKSMNPAVVTVAREVRKPQPHNIPLAIRQSSRPFNAIFESLEATLPPISPERIIMEEVLFGREIIYIVAGEGEERKERYESWVGVM